MERRRGTNGRAGGEVSTPRRTPRGGGGEGGAPPIRGHTPRKALQRCNSIADDAASDASDVFSDDDSSQYSAYTDRSVL